MVVGFLVGVTGVGAGALMTPLLIGVFGVPIPLAVATDLLFATVTKLVGVGLHHREGHIQWQVARRLWLGSIPGALAGVGLVILLADRSLGEWLTWPLVVIVLLASITLAGRAFRVYSAEVSESLEPDPNYEKGRILGPVGSFGIGLAVSLTSVGAGALGMALLVRISPRNTKPKYLVGTDLVHAIPIALIAGVAYGSAGLVSFPLLGTLLVGSIPGVAIGSLVASRIPHRPINLTLAGVLLAAAIALMVRALS